MKDVSYEILDLIKKHGKDRTAILKENSKPEYLYALSDIRENLLEWFEFAREGRLLQVGSDYGALTGLFSRKTGQVTVLDDRDENLAVNRARNGGDGNISYVKGCLSAFNSDEKYDYVVMAGCMEAADPSMICKARGLLREGGYLIAAVNNPFGLKYWAGAVKDEDVPFLSLAESRKIYPSGHIYYPMPDYRLPVTLYSDSYLPKKGELTHISETYDWGRYQLFDEEAKFDALCEDGRFEEFANSFLMIEQYNG